MIKHYVVNGLSNDFLIVVPGGCKKHNFWNTLVHPLKNYISGILRLKPIDWYMHGTDPRRGGVVERGFDFLGHPLQNFSGPLLQNFKDTTKFLSSRTVYWHPLWVN
jgi:hypothetical protein